MKTYRIECNGNEIHISKMCTIKGNFYKVKLQLWQFNEWKDGAKVTDFAPDMSADDREFLISGTTPAEWDVMFPPEDPYDDPSDYINLEQS